MFKQVKSAFFWYYLYKFRKRAIVIFFLILIALFSGFIYGDVVEFLKLTNRLEYLKFVLLAKWFIIIFNILISIYLILTLFKNSDESKKQESIKEEKIKPKRDDKDNFSKREKEFLYKTRLTTKADSLIKK